MTSTLPSLPLFEAISRHDPNSIAVVHCLSGRTFTYGELLPDVARTRDRLHEAAGKPDIRGERIAFLVENSYDYVVTLLAILAARAIALPLSPPFPPAELQYILSHSEALLLLHSPRYASKAKEVIVTPNPPSNPEPHPHPKVLELPKHLGGEAGSPRETVTLSGDTDSEGAGMMLYTSGTTNRPKGVLLPETALTAQCHSLIDAWKYTPEDRLLHVLPLHHIHGTVNALLTPLFAGSSIEFTFPFNADSLWWRFATPFLAKPLMNGTLNHVPNGDLEPSSPRAEEKYKHMSTAPITFFTVVPTVYTRLLLTHQSLPADLAKASRIAISPKHMRVSISGSAALPTPVKRAWKDLSHGNVLLERYGMTEVGMALSCGLDYTDRVDGSVGWPLPGVEARLVDPETNQIIAEGQETDENGRERQGEIQLRGKNVFREYWRNPDATAKEFVSDNKTEGKWFKTGDVAVRRPVDSAGHGVSGDWAKGPMYFILGRQSADIIKSGGEKVSALEVEREILSLPQVAEAAVLAVPSGKWGQKVGAVIVLSELYKDNGWKPMEMRRALRDKLANYKIPQVLRVVQSIPRNAMGKVNKKTLVQAVFKDDFSGDEM
ncbi:AMP-binding enzyme [Pseudomassariella vexata]|uniref:AMP-binding enzyme n=1 Tax=Pseudomassariella vexata TaxID=1141098 RepID=A0A1Y2DD85_9PEZI|nr:AMP-binding enzyme [Pseudomassariella vexata]ORY57199.1 AMP-binding enzyme [Pseudomassariella vexata]